MRTSQSFSSPSRPYPLDILQDLIQDELSCAICLDTCTNALVNPECSHRFCGKCIKKSLTNCKHECPICRSYIPTYRSLRPDLQFDRIVSAARLESSLLEMNNEMGNSVVDTTIVIQYCSRTIATYYIAYIYFSYYCYYRLLTYYYYPRHFFLTTDAKTRRAVGSIVDFLFESAGYQSDQQQ